MDVLAWVSFRFPTAKRPEVHKMALKGLTSRSTKSYCYPQQTPGRTTVSFIGLAARHPLQRSSLICSRDKCHQCRVLSALRSYQWFRQTCETCTKNELLILNQIWCGLYLDVAQVAYLYILVMVKYENQMLHCPVNPWKSIRVVINQMIYMQMKINCYVLKKSTLYKVAEYKAFHVPKWDIYEHSGHTSPVKFRCKWIMHALNPNPRNGGRPIQCLITRYHEVSEPQNWKWYCLNTRNFKTEMIYTEIL